MPVTAAVFDRAALGARYREVRTHTEALCRRLSPEDCNLQSMPDASPAKWHLAHSTWFFETFVLSKSDGYEPFDPAFNFLFNSYYEAVGSRHPRPKRGMLSRPSVAEVFRYRAVIDERMAAFLANATEDQLQTVEPILTLGLHHEQQHQELILTDILHAFSLNPLKPAYNTRFFESAIRNPQSAIQWLDFESGVRWIGHDGDGFAFDNEGPRHRQWVEAFRIADRLATNGEFHAFMADGGYERPELWLSDGWAAKNANNWSAPLYWERGDDGWERFTLAGMKPIEPDEAVCHLSFYEADAFARWAGARLPTEAEWEVAVADAADQIHQVSNTVWQWTASPYVAYPGYRPAAGALGEYNGKFMCNQLVLRGGSLATPPGHARPTYRNFFPPDARWQFAGLRLASDR
jgi:ergothioneine biosynthesis protein EgtB